MSFIKKIKKKLKERKSKNFIAKFDIICDVCGKDFNAYKQSSLCPHESIEEFLRSNQHNPDDAK